MPLASLGALVATAIMLSLWGAHRVLRNASLVDVGWTFTLGVLALLAAALGTGDPTRRLIVALVGGVWSARLTIHLVQRVASEPEDPRYAELRARWGGNLGVKFFALFVGQGLLDVVLALPFFLAANDPSPTLHPLLWGGVALAIVSVTGEAIADAQLRRFRADSANRGKVCRVGLWSWSRHPNYFFEWLIWCAFAQLALGSPHGTLALIPPALMLHFLTRVTGIAATEAHALKSRGNAYRQYQREVSAFVPRPPRVEK